MPSKNFDATFADVPAQQKAALQSFWAEHPYRELVFEGRRWRYVRAGDARATVLLLPDAYTPGDRWFRVIQSLAAHYTLIAPSAHALMGAYDLEVACAAYIRMLETEDRYAASAVGALEGGYLLQYMLQTYPHRVQNIVLGRCGALGSNVRVPGSSLCQRLSLHLLPWSFTSKQMLNTMTADLPESGNWLAFTKAYLRLILGDLSRETVMGYISHTLPAYRRFRPAPRRMAGWDGHVLLLTEGNGHKEEKRLEDLLRRYPLADTYTTVAKGSYPFLLYPEPTIKRLQTFLRSVHA